MTERIENRLIQKPLPNFEGYSFEGKMVQLSPTPQESTKSYGSIRGKIIYQSPLTLELRPEPKRLETVTLENLEEESKLYCVDRVEMVYLSFVPTPEIKIIPKSSEKKRVINPLPTFTLHSDVRRKVSSWWEAHSPQIKEFILGPNPPSDDIPERVIIFDHIASPPPDGRKRDPLVQQFFNEAQDTATAVDIFASFRENAVPSDETLAKQILSNLGLKKKPQPTSPSMMGD